MTGKEAIASIRKQTERLISEHSKVVGQRDRLESECKTLRDENRSLREQVRRLESELTLAQVSSGLSGNENNRKKARARINRLMREVDRCIAIVSKIE